MTGNNALQNTISSQKEYNHDINHICPACWVYLSTSHLYSRSWIWDWSKLVTHRSAAVAQITALDRSSDNPTIETATTPNPTIILWVGAPPPPHHPPRFSHCIRHRSGSWVDHKIVHESNSYWKHLSCWIQWRRTFDNLWSAREIKPSAQWLWVGMEMLWLLWLQHF